MKNTSLWILFKPLTASQIKCWSVQQHWTLPHRPRVSLSMTKSLILPFAIHSAQPAHDKHILCFSSKSWRQKFISAGYSFLSRWKHQAAAGCHKINHVTHSQDSQNPHMQTMASEWILLMGLKSQQDHKSIQSLMLHPDVHVEPYLKQGDPPGATRKSKPAVLGTIHQNWENHQLQIADELEQEQLQPEVRRGEGRIKKKKFSSSSLKMCFHNIT